jgi:hypothetical protein
MNHNNYGPGVTMQRLRSRPYQNAVDYIRQNPAEIYDLLQSLDKEIQDLNEVIRKPDKNFFFKIFDNFRRSNSQELEEQARKLGKLEASINTLNSELERSRNDNQHYTNRIQEQKKAYDQEIQRMNERLNRLLAESAAKNIDRAQFSVNDTNPEDYQVAPKYLQLCNGRLSSLSNEIYSAISSEVSQDSPRQLLIAQIKSNLSKIVIVETFEHLSINLDFESDGFIDKKMMGIYPEITDTRIREQINEFCNTCYTMVKEILTSNPPGVLYSAEGTSFAPELHQREVGSDESEIVKFTTRPGLRSGDHIFYKPLVFTWSEPARNAL